MAHKTEVKFWKEMTHGIQARLLAGVLILMPFGVALLVIVWLFRWFTGLMKPLVNAILAVLGRYSPAVAVPQVYVTVFIWLSTTIILLLLLYLLGVVGQFVIGKKVVAASEVLVLRIPLVSTIYTATKQVIKALSIPDSKAFKSVVLVEFPRAGFQAVGYLTGNIKTPDGREFSKVFIPTTPNPTTGFFELVPPNEVVETNLTIEEAFKMIISGGMVSPDVLLSRTMNVDGQKIEQKTAGGVSTEGEAFYG
jgi:uncharacterized membrane protein